MSAIRDKLRAYVVENYLFGQDGNLNDGDSFLELGIIDSTGVLELVSHLEEQYGISIDSEDIAPENLDSIESLTNFVSRKQAQAATALAQGEIAQ